MTSGILNVNKPVGWTSFDVVRFVRRGAGVKRVGHAGTLDPAADGVLLVLLGQAARVTEYLMDLAKTYRATVRLGVSTTTYDSEGEVTSTADATGVTEANVREALRAFVGEIEQVPPAYSALKVGGEAAYAKARRGEAVEMKPRRAVVYRAELLRYDAPLAEVEVECGRGTYIRSIAHDLGQALGVGAHLASLTRTRIGPFTLDAAHSEPELRAAFEDGTWPSLLEPVDCGLMSLPALTLDIEDEKDIRHGQAVQLDEPVTAHLEGALADGLEARAYAEDGSLVGIIRWDAGLAMWRPRKVFTPETR